MQRSKWHIILPTIEYDNFSVISVLFKHVEEAFSDWIIDSYKYSFVYFLLFQTMQWPMWHIISLTIHNNVLSSKKPFILNFNTKSTLLTLRFAKTIFRWELVLQDSMDWLAWAKNSLFKTSENLLETSRKFELQTLFLESLISILS